MICVYYRCENKICPESDRHCSDHHGELSELFRLQYYQGVIDFYIESNGGKARLAALLAERNYQRKGKGK